MIAFNLIPDIKRDYLNAKAMRDRVMTWSVLVAGSFVGLVIIASIIIGVQWYIVDSTKDDIAALSEELNNKENIEEVLTVRNQLTDLPGMHEEKPKTTRLFSYLSTLTPSGVSLTALEVDMNDNTMEISGTAENVRGLNVFVNTLKGAEYELGPELTESEEDFEDISTQQDQDFSEIELSDPQPAFSRVVSTLSIESGGGGVNFTVNLEFDPAIFDSAYSAVRMSISESVDGNSQDSDTIFDGENVEEEGQQ